MNKAQIIAAIESANRVFKSGEPPPSSTVGHMENSVRPNNHVAQGPASRCGDLECKGCYEVAPGKLIHPRKSGQEWENWLARWQPKGEATKQ